MSCAAVSSLAINRLTKAREAAQMTYIHPMQSTRR
jgi:hypothetical protein